MNNPLAFLSLDLDDKWSYLRTCGSPDWQDYPSYLPEVMPIILEFLRRHELKITFFLVGRDVVEPANADCIQAIAFDGHDLGNHSYNHFPWLHLLSEEDLDLEIGLAEEAVRDATGQTTTGFRGPGYSISETHLNVLVKRGYRYDASVFPNALNPLARAYLFAKSDLSPEEKKQRKGLFGTLSDATRPIAPFEWKLAANSLVEIPVTTMPLFRVPFHFSYIIYLSGYSRSLAAMYFRLALWLCRKTRTSPSILFHPLDFLGREDDSDLEFFPGMNLARNHKLEVLSQCVRDLKRDFRITSLAEPTTEILRSSGNLRTYVPDFKL